MGSTWYQRQGKTLILRLRCQANARCNEVSGLHGDRLKVRLTAPPIDGRANACLTDFIAAEFGVGRRQVRLLNGEHSRDKRVAIDDPGRAPRWFEELS